MFFVDSLEYLLYASFSGNSVVHIQCHMLCYPLHISIVFLCAHSFVNLNVAESWFCVDVKEPVAYAKVEVIEASELKPSDLNGYPLPLIISYELLFLLFL